MNNFHWGLLVLDVGDNRGTWIQPGGMRMQAFPLELEGRLQFLPPGFHRTPSSSSHYLVSLRGQTTTFTWVFGPYSVINK